MEKRSRPLGSLDQRDTGYPIVDAAARQLLATGFVHNRARMIAASFLTKHLQTDYRFGEAHYMKWLTDGDWAQNNMGWQWAAGSGADAQPWFRIFNPMTQGRKFDPDGDYIRTWVPELASVSTKHIHAPWEAKPVELDWCVFDSVSTTPTRSSITPKLGLLFARCTISSGTQTNGRRNRKPPWSLMLSRPTLTTLPNDQLQTRSKYLHIGQRP